MVKKELWERAKDLLDEVLKLEPKNAKATNRKLTCMLKLNMISKLETDVPYLRNTIDTFNETNKATDINELKKTLQHYACRLGQATHTAPRHVKGRRTVPYPKRERTSKTP